MSRRGENVYKRKDGRWEGRIQVEKGKYKHYYAKSYKEVKQKMLVNTRPGYSGASNDTIVASKALKAWLKKTKERVKASTFENYYYCANSYIIPFFQNAEEDEFSLQQIKSFRSHICDHGLSFTYQKKILSIFKVALRSILKNDKAASRLLDSLLMPKVQAMPVQVFSLEEQQRIEKLLVHSGSNKAIGLLLCFYTGLRLGEMCALRWQDIDLNANTLSIVGTALRIKNFDSNQQKTKLMIGSPKNRTSMRIIPLPEFLIERLRSIDGLRNHFIVSGCETPLDPRSMQRYFKSILKRANVDYRKFHTIRHTFATRALEIGIDIKTLSELLGHASVTNTLNIYTHSLLEQKKSAMLKLNSMHMTSMAFTVK